ncbi:hypothetical protein NPIL_341161 [Nephila pilipes]|uniref:Uncharacterized protein n=1 Tax=Nephila pilipes TaxID=299642 RepID=A0A8X6UJ85_NEPPI|nr:hypothetical protein NPIL_341161 [Nephila pilipes]
MWRERNRKTSDLAVCGQSNEIVNSDYGYLRIWILFIYIPQCPAVAAVCIHNSKPDTTVAIRLSMQKNPDFKKSSSQVKTIVLVKVDNPSQQKTTIETFFTEQH